MIRFPVSFTVIALAICLVFCSAHAAFSQEDMGDSVDFSQEYSPLEEPQDSYDSDDGEYGSLSPEAYEEAPGEPVYESSGNVVVEINSETRKESEGAEETNNNLISLDLKGIDIIEVFRILSMKIGKTVVASKGVSGRVNLFLNNVTFEDALEVILITQGLAREQKGNIIMVMRDVEYKRRYGKDYSEKRELRSLKLEYARPSDVFNVLSKVKSDIGKIIVDEGSGNIILIDVPERLDLMEKVIHDMDQPLKVRTFDLNYAEVAVMRDHLENMITEGPGRVFIDERTNKIIVSDLDEKIKDIEHMIKVFDEETRQVFIEAMILQVVLKEEFQRGINWESILTSSSGPFSWLDGLNIANTFPSSPSFSPSPDIGGSNTTLSIGTLGSNNYTYVLNFLETFGDTKVLSRPKIAVINNEEASILVGTREAYVTQSLSQGESTTVTSESVQFIDVGVKLNVTPTINKDNFVTLKIRPEVSTVRETLSTALGSNIPIVETSEASTTVKIKSGSTILIGGLMKEERRDDVSGIPFFSKIPLLGVLFGSRAKLKKKTELIIFLRPDIMTGENSISLMGRDANTIISPKMWPDEMRWEFIKNEIDRIGFDSFEDESKRGNISKPPARPTTVLANTVIQEKLKGIKKY